MFSLRFAALGWFFVALAASGFAGTKKISYLGVGVVAVNEQIARELNWTGSGGLFVTMVQAASPAEKAGLEPDDIMVSFNGKRLSDPAELGSLVVALPPGRKVHVEVFRAGKTVHLAPVLAAREQPPSPEPLVRFDLPTPDTFFTDMPSPALRWRNGLVGVEYEGVDSQLAQFFGVKQGVLIRFVRPGSAGGESGIHAGDVVTKVNGKPIGNPRDFALALQNRPQPGKSLAMEIVRDRPERSVKIKLPAADSGVAPWAHPVAVPQVPR
jgi:serine protease Do